MCTVVVVEIRQEKPGDSDSIADLQREAFADRGAVVAALVADLRASASSGNGLSLVRDP